MSDRETIDIIAGERKKTVYRDAYVKATVRGLKESFPSVTAEEVNEQLDLLLSGEKWTNVIGAIIEKDLELPRVGSTPERRFRMTDELRAAIRTYRNTDNDGEFGCYGPDGERNDLEFSTAVETIVSWAEKHLAEHPPDDEECADMQWLCGFGFWTEPGGPEGSINLRCSNSNVVGNEDLDIVISFGRFVSIKNPTRGQIRRLLCPELGTQLKEVGDVE